MIVEWMILPILLGFPSIVIAASLITSGWLDRKVFLIKSGSILFILMLLLLFVFYFTVRGGR